MGIEQPSLEDLHRQRLDMKVRKDHITANLIVISSKFDELAKLAVEVVDHLDKSFTEKDTVLLQSELLKFGLRAIIKVALR
jgi:hypothetical protein